MCSSVSCFLFCCLQVNDSRPTYRFEVVDKETNEIVTEANLRGLETDYLIKHFKPVFCRIDYTTQGKVATPAFNL